MSEQAIRHLEEPEDYFNGVGREPLPTPMDILLFNRTALERLQQEAIQNRSHHRHVMIFNLATEGHVHVDDRVFLFAPGQALVILPYQFHHYSHLASDRLTWLFCTFLLEDTSFIEPLRNGVIKVNAGLARARDALVQTWCRRGDGLDDAGPWSQQLQADLIRVLLLLARARRGQPPAPAPAGTLLHRVNRQLAAWSRRPVSVADLARAFDESESRLRARFRAAAGVPLGRYLLNYRLNRAMHLLRRDETPIAEVARESGFGSPQAFSRAFRAATGCSPRAYRTLQARPL